jgi:hypothetical protein
MNRKDVFAAVRALGMVCTYDADCGEYRVAFPLKHYAETADPRSLAERQEAEAYYTPHGEDALGTAQVMMQRHLRSLPAR